MNEAEIEAGQGHILGCSAIAEEAGYFHIYIRTGHRHKAEKMKSYI